MILKREQEGSGLVLCQGHGWYLSPELEARAPGIQLTLFVAIHSRSFKSRDMLLNEKTHLPVPTPLRRVERGRQSSPFSTTFSKMFMKFFWAIPLRDVSCDFAISSNSCG